MPYNTQKNAIRNYLDKKERVYIWCDPDEKELIKSKAEQAGKSINQYIKDLVISSINSRE